jgi:hypothetical protein
MKKHACFLIPLALFSASAFSNISSRETSNQVVIKSDKTSVKANLVYTGQSSQLSVGLGSKPITDFRGGAAKSRLSGCGVSPTSAYSTETAAKAAVKACFSEAIYNQIEADMAYLMKNQNAQTAIYTFTQPVTMQFKVRNAAGVSTVKESMFVSTTVLMRAGDAIGGSTRMGFLMSARATTQYLYVKYEQGKNFDMFDAGMKMPDAGKALVYTITDPNNVNANRLLYSQLGTINKYDEPMEPTDARVENEYDQDQGLKTLLADLKPVMEETGSAAAIIDYGRRVEPKYNQDSSGNLTPELFEIRVKDRSYYRNECTAAGVHLSQVAQMNIKTDYRRDRIIVSNLNQLTSPIRMGNLAVQENISTVGDANAAKFIGKTITVSQSETFTGYPYSNPFLTYKNKVMDPIGNNSSAPNNLFTEWTDDIFNKLPASVYKEIAPMRDDSVCKLEYLETYEVAAGYWKQEPQYGTITNCTGIPTGGQKCNTYSGIVGYQSVWEPAIYGKRLASACVHNAQVNTYCQGRECVTTCGTTAKGGQYYWLMGAWGGCSNGCGTGTQTRTVVCKNKTGTTVSDTYCSSAGSKPPTSQPCQGVSSCGYAWNVGGWSGCSDNCNGGYQTRNIYCRRSDGSVVPDAYCGGKPAAIQQCSNPSAPECVKIWRYTPTIRCGVTSYGADAFFCATTTAIWPQINNSSYDGHSIDILGTKYLFAMEMISYPEDVGNKANAFGMITLKPQTAAANSITFSVNINNKGWERITFTKSGAGYKDIDIIGDKYDMLSTVNGKYGAEFDFSDRTREVLIKDIVVK